MSDIKQLGRVRVPNDGRLDCMNWAYRNEYARWTERARIVTSGQRCQWELVRNTSPNNDISADAFHEITKLDARSCKSRDDAQSWLRTYAGRAAMRAAMEQL